MQNSSLDPKVDFVIKQISTMVGSEGGKLTDIQMDGELLSLKYTPGVNKECPECVPTHQQVEMFLKTSLGIHAPNVKSVQINWKIKNQ